MNPKSFSLCFTVYNLVSQIIHGTDTSSSSLRTSVNVGAVGGYCFPVGAVGGYCFRVGVYCEWVGAIVLFVYSIVCELKDSAWPSMWSSLCANTMIQ